MAPHRSSQGKPLLSMAQFRVSPIPHADNRHSWSIAGCLGVLLLLTNLPRTLSCNDAERFIRAVLAFYHIREPKSFYCHQKARYHRRHVHTHEGWVYIVMPDEIAAAQAQYLLDGLVLLRGHLRAVLGRKPVTQTITERAHNPAPKIPVRAPKKQPSLSSYDHGTINTDGLGVVTVDQSPRCESVADEEEDYVMQEVDDGVCRVVETNDVKGMREAMKKMNNDENEDVLM